ncbi:VOC family protein [Thermoactinospora rubra]|uniref:VOC family protein n=1 Tax=Thermoactinospora rubra TaxID=1088767 RepID=UPI001F0B3FC1|nr:VOC family protein [Thermoactinospora rubra]
MRAIRIDRLDHLVLTVADVETMVDFYTRVLGMTPVTFGDGRRAPFRRTGPIDSVYLRDPDGNLIEIGVPSPA